MMSFIGRSRRLARYRAAGYRGERRSCTRLAAPRDRMDSAAVATAPGVAGSARVARGRRSPLLSRAARSSGSSSTRRTPTTTPTTRCCGAARCCTATCRPSTATARRPSTRWRSRSAPLLSLLGAGRRPRDGLARRWRRSSRSSAGMYRLGRASLHAAGRRGRGGAAAAPASTSRSSPRAATSTSRTWRWSSGRPRWRRSARAAACRSSCCSRAPGCCGPRRGCSAGCTGCGWAGGATWRERVALRGAGRGRPGGLGARSTAPSPGDPLFSLHHTSDLAEELGAREAAWRGAAATPDFLRRSTSCRSCSAGSLGSRWRSGGARGAR